MRILHKLLALHPSELKLLVQAYVLVGVVRVGLWSLSFQRLRGWLSRIPAVSSASHRLYAPSLAQIARAVKIASRYTPGGAKCLAQALTGQVLLKRWRYPHRLRIGVAKSLQGTFEAHAWIEVEGKVIIGRINNLGHFTPLPALEI